MAGFGTGIVELVDVAAGALELPAVRLPVVIGVVHREPTLGKAHDQIRGEGTPRRGVVLARPVLARTLEELIVPPGNRARGR